MLNTEIPKDDRQHAPLEKGMVKLLTPVSQFLESQSTTGILLIIATIAALYFANSPYQHYYDSINHLPFGFTLGQWHLSYSLHEWINEGLMVLFFFVLGLEIKRELLTGQLHDLRQSTLVVFMAVGGMLIPAIIYLMFAYLGDIRAIHGWGIPMATDTAFAISILAILGKRVPQSAMVLLMALAIVDDIGAVMVIGLFYTDHLQLWYLLEVGLALGALYLINILGVRNPWPYIIGGAVLWWFVSQSGIHATTAGILAAMAVPTRPYAQTSWFIRRLRKLLNRFEELDEPDQTILEANKQHEIAEEVREVAIQTTTPLQHWSTLLDKPVSWLILPIFAFLNAGVNLSFNYSQLLHSTVFLGVVCGLVVGKSVGISVFAALAHFCKVCKIPNKLKAYHIIGIAFLAGIGFTMSMFITTIAFDDNPDFVIQAKLGILTGSLIAALIGTVILYVQGGSESKTATN